MTQRARILVVDDDLPIRDMMKLILRSAGYEVQSATNGEEALASMDGFRPDAVVLDWRMPVMSGQEFLEEYRRRGGERPVVVVTADHPAAVAPARPDGCIRKPFRPEELLASVEAVLRSDRPQNMMQLADIVESELMGTQYRGGLRLEYKPRY